MRILLRSVAAAAVMSLISPGPAPAAPSERPYIVVYETRSQAQGRATTAELVREEGVDPELRYGSAIQGFAADLTRDEVDELRRDRRVASVTPDLPVRIAGAVDVVDGDRVPTGVRRTGVASETKAREASAVNVAVIDTGIDLDHPDLNVAAGRDCTGAGTADDANGHGTHVAGTIAARNDGRGVVGVAPGTRVWAVRVLDRNGAGSMSGVICGVDWVTATRRDASAANDIAVANMSLGGGGRPGRNCGRTTRDALHAAVCASVAAGVTYVVAAGNSGRDLKDSVPASYPEVLTVTAVSDADGRPGGAGGAVPCVSHADDTAASYSNFATRSVDIQRLLAAPGSCIASSWPGGGHRTASGTSMASPHVAGLAALCLSEGATPGPCSGGKPADVIAMLRGAARDRSAAEPGWGFAGDPTRPFTGRVYGHLASPLVAATAVDLTATAPTSAAVPQITGSVAVGVAATATLGAWSGTAPIAYDVQWLRCTSPLLGDCVPIADAVSSTYTPVTGDRPMLLRVRVSARNAHGAAEAVSAPTAAVAAPPDALSRPLLRGAPAIIGAVAPGARLLAGPGTWGGATPMAFSYHWATCRPGATTCTANGGVGPAFTVPAVAPGTRFVVVVFARNRFGAAMATSSPTGLSGLTSGPPGVSGLPDDGG